MMRFDYGDMSGWAVFAMSVWMVAFWALIIFVIAAAIRWVVASRGERLSDVGAILARRLASGEIDEDEYRQRLDTLRRT